MAEPLRDLRLRERVLKRNPLGADLVIVQTIDRVYPPVRQRAAQVFASVGAVLTEASGVIYRPPANGAWVSIVTSTATPTRAGLVAPFVLTPQAGAIVLQSYPDAPIRGSVQGFSSAVLSGIVLTANSQIAALFVPPERWFFVARDVINQGFVGGFFVEECMAGDEDL